MPRERGDSVSVPFLMPPNGSGPLSDLTDHLWQSFLQKTTADVVLRVTGSWRALYHLHKVVIIQSGFFRSLFTAGFSEAGSKNNHERIIDIVFDDANITRSAFEFCIARLYGGGPPIHIPPSLIPTTSRPLTPHYPFSLSSNVPFIQDPTPPNTQPGSPAFLLSLLATSVYLSIPSIASNALDSVLKTVGPHTLLHYLDFACGKPVTEIEGSEELDNAAVGLEGVAEILRAPDASPAVSIRTTRGIERDVDRMSLQGVKNDSDTSDHLDSVSNAGSDVEDEDDEDDHSPHYHYGPVSDKIGEACVCWLARWGVDILTWEEKFWNHNSSSFSGTQSKRRKTRASPSSSSTLLPGGMVVLSARFPYKPQSVPLIFSPGGLSPHWIKALVSADSFFVKGEKDRYDIATRIVELRRRLEGVKEKEEKVWKTLFEEGIYYANMSMEDVVQISQDVSPTTGQPYVSLSTLQASHWEQSILKHRLMSRPNSPTSSPSPFPSSGAKGDKRLGISKTVEEVRSEKNSAYWFAIPGDSSTRLGDSGHNTGSSGNDHPPVTMEQLFNSPIISPPTSAGPSPSLLSPSSSGATGSAFSSSPSAIPGSSKLKTTEANFFGLTTSKHPVLQLRPAPSSTQTQYSPYPPFRFSVEFFDIDALKEKSRLHSQTIWYAGSLFNVYTQIVRKKASSSGGTKGEIQTKMGIYLHRQSSVEMLPPASAPSLIAERVERERKGDEGLSSVSAGRPITSSSSSAALQHNRGPSLPSSLAAGGTPSTPPSPSHYSPSVHPTPGSRSTTPGSTAGTSSSLPSSLAHPSAFNFPPTVSATLPATSPSPVPQQPFRDPRGSISAYFSISCSSATGTSQTRFESSPDEFAVSQSWGWTSSSLRTEEYLDVANSGKEIEVGKEVSLRATVVLGLV